MMSPAEIDLQDQIAAMRSEIRELRKAVNALMGMMMEEGGDVDERMPPDHHDHDLSRYYN